MSRLLLISLLFVGSFFVVQGKAHAQNDPCNPLFVTQYSVISCIFTNIVEVAPEIDIIRTMINSPSVIIVNFIMSVLADSSWDELILCSREQQPFLQQCRVGESSTCGFSITRQNTRGNGSLFGFAHKVGYVISQPDILPVNLALWFKDEVKDIPVLGDSAFAQTVNYPNVIAAEFVLTLWRQFRNLAYGFLSLVMIVIGIMIMVRKKANPQMVITMQNAIPRVIIAMVLITFSYPIGATAASFTGPLMKLSGDVLAGVADLCAGSNEPVNFGGLSLLILMFPMVMLDTGSIPTGIGTITILSFVLMFALLIMLMAFFSMVLVYIKILGSIVFAPIRFALGAIPGNESNTIDWFKLLAARVLSIPAMFFMISLAYRIPLYAFVTGFGGTNFLGFSGTFIAGILGSAQNSLMWTIAPFIMLMLLGQTLSIPKKVEEMFMGPPQRKR